MEAVIPMELCGRKWTRQIVVSLIVQNLCVVLIERVKMVLACAMAVTQMMAVEVSK